MRWLANSDTFGAVLSLACLIRAHNLAIRLLTFYIANCIFGFLAGSMAFWWLTYRFTYGITPGIVAFPGTLRMAGLLGKTR
jgi:hypothetical protein